MPRPEHAEQIAKMIRWWGNWQAQLTETMCKELEAQLITLREKEREEEGGLQEVLVLYTWVRDRDYWLADTGARDLRAPAQLHQAAAGKAADIMEGETGAIVKILPHAAMSDSSPSPLTVSIYARMRGRGQAENNISA